MILDTFHILGIVITLLLMSAVGIYSGRKVKTAEDFATSGRKGSPTLVAGTLMGTLISGSSTVGTAQLAFQFGFSAWWYTLGVAMALLVWGSGFGRRMYETHVDTLPQYLVKTYGGSIGPISAVFTGVGIYFNFIANMLAFVALFTAMFHMPPLAAAVIGTLLVLAYVAFGGIWGTGLNGVFKMVILYAAMIAAGVTAYVMVGGISGLTAHFSRYPWFSLFGRGFDVDLAAGTSVVLGIMSTQTHFQAIVSGRSFTASRKGAIISAMLTPPVGLGAIMVGLYMRAAYPQTPSNEALPTFVLQVFSPFWAGIIMAVLLIAIVGGLAGLGLGISTLFVKDIYKRYFRPRASSKEILLTQRLSIAVICSATVVFVSSAMGTLILTWSFLSMGLRACTILAPLIGAMFFRRWVTPTAGIAAALLGPLTDIVWYIAYPKGIDPLYPGLVVSVLVLVIVSVFGKKNAVPELSSARQMKVGE